MQAFRRSTSIISSRQLVAARGSSLAVARPFSTSTVRPDADQPVKRDAAADSFKRGAKNTTGVIGQAGKFVADTLRDIGDAAKEIVSDGRAEGKTTRQHASEMVRDRVSGRKKTEGSDK